MTFTNPQLPAPIKCDNCGSDRVGLTSNAVIYGENKGDWPYCYYCDDCSSMVGCHPNTYNPMGFMANSNVRRLRSKLHTLLDPIWKDKLLSRSYIYNWLANQLCIENEECHISQLNQKQLEKAIVILSKHKENDYLLFKRRKIKKDDRKSAANRRTHNKINRRKS